MNTGEREMPSIPGTIEGIDEQHIQRYRFARAFVQGRQVYDAACGCGYGSLILDAKYYVGYDYSAEAIEFATEHYSNDRVLFIQRDLHNMVASEARLDVCVSFETVEHLQEPGKFLEWAAEHCQVFIGSSPIAQSCLHSPFHVREYSVAEFKEILGRYWRNVELFTQTGEGIRFPSQSGDLGNVIGVCW